MPESETTPVLSRSAHERLAEELQQLQTEGRRAVAERLQRARELGDISENAEYHATKEEQALMEARIRKLEHLLKTASVVDAPIVSDEAVPGTVVHLRTAGEPSADVEIYLLAASNEERAKTVHTVTVASPLGQAINGARIGEVVKYQAPGGVFAYEVVKIEPWDGSL